MSAEISIDTAEGQILIGVQGEAIAATASISEGADPDEINEAIESLRNELHHSRRVGGSL